MDRSKQKLKEVSEKFISDTFFMPIIGAEIEFYLPNSNLEEINKACKKAGVDFLDVKA
jgi:hypothetical protein